MKGTRGANGGNYLDALARAFDPCSFLSYDQLSKSLNLMSASSPRTMGADLCR